MSDLKTKNILSKEKEVVKKSYGELVNNTLLDKANTLPKSSGCYFMKGDIGQVLYVGKAKDLKSRVTSYFNNSAKSPKTQLLVSHIKDFEFILTNSEAESLILENNLIKQYKPKYNIQLKDDKTYPYLQLNTNEAYPRLEYVRKPKKKKGLELYGPFPVGSNISKIIRVLTKSFTLRDCSLYEFNNRKEPCLLYQMKQCSAPCVGKISFDEYQSDLDKALGLFKNKKTVEDTLAVITNKMMAHAEKEEFEIAAQIRDYLEELTSFTEKSFDQNVEALNDSHADIVSYYKGEEEVDISIYLIRRGNLIGQKNFHFLNDDLLDEVEQEIILAMTQYYSQNIETIPEKIITSFEKSNAESFYMALKEIVGEGIKFKVQSQTKKYNSLLTATKKHAEECQRVRQENQDSVYIGLNKLKDLLNMKERPKTIECYDIAIWQGKSPTASQVFFYEGKPDKTGYKYYHLNERPEGNNDFAMMSEVFERRLKHGDFPDVFLVDGGVQQVNTVKKVLEQFKVEVPVVGIAKSRTLKKFNFKSSEVESSDERLVIQGRSNPYILNKCPSLLRILVQLRDEAHRFSRKLHHKTEKKRIIQSWVDKVKGLNPNVRKRILSNNSLSKEELGKMNITDLQNYLGIEQRHARILYDYLHAEEN